MVWVRIDDHFDEHPKIAALSDSAVAVMVAGLSYCNRNLTDGFIPHMIGLGKLRFCGGNTTPILKELEAAGIFEPVDGGWHIHDYLEYQPSKQKVIEERAASAKRMQGTRRRRKVALHVAPQHAPMLQTSCTFPVPGPVPVPDSVPEPKRPDNTSPPAEEVWPSPRLLIAKYNAEAPDECPAVKTISQGRIKKAKQYLAQFPQEEFWSAVFKQMHASRFLRGLTEKSNGHASFVADLDWLLTKGKDGSENAAKVRDGRYRDG